MVVTVTPATSTVTAYATATNTITLPGMKKLLVQERQVTVVPSRTPSYAAACSTTGAYSSACSCWGITATTTTAPNPVTTTTITTTATATTCPISDTMCGTSCVNLLTNANNCGACGAPCASGAACTGGTCLCSNSGLAQCNGLCPNYQTDSSHCGSCANQCFSGDICSSGSCVARYHTCAGNPAEWFAIADTEQIPVGSSGNTDETCAMAPCAEVCDATPGCVGFIVESDDPNDTKPWLCDIISRTSYERITRRGATYGDEYLYYLSI